MGINKTLGCHETKLNHDLKHEKTKKKHFGSPINPHNYDAILITITLNSLTVSGKQAQVILLSLLL